MSWLYNYFVGGNETDSGIPEPTDAEKRRNEQIEGLRAAAPSVSEVQRDQHYRVDTVVKGEPLYLDIFLPPQFPVSAPLITVSRPLHHPWITDQTLSQCPSLNTFSVHSNLGEVVSEIIQELNDNSTLLPSPPPLPSSTSPSSSSEVAMSSPHSQSMLPSLHQRSPPGGTGYQPYYQFNSASQPAATATVAVPRPVSPRSSPKPKRKAPPPPRVVMRGYTPPPVPSEFPTISTMSEEELEKLLDEKEGPVLVENFVRNLDAVKKIQADRDLLFQENEDQARINLGHEPELQNGWTRLQEKTFELLAEKEKYDKQLREQQRIRDKFLNFGKTAASRLKSLAQEAETESEILAEDFLENKMKDAEFIRNFKEKRKLHHLRMSKYEKLQHGPRRH